MKSTEQLKAEQYTHGVVMYLCGFLSKLIVTIIIIASLLALSGFNKDSTDTSNWHRSGMRLYTDAATGVQYLSDGKGGLTPRIYSDGKIVTVDDFK